MEKLEIKEKKEELLELENEIKKLKRAKRVKCRKNSIIALFLWAPAITWTGMYAWLAVLDKNIPGYLDYVTKKAHTTTMYSSITGEIESEKEYALKDDLPNDVLLYYGPCVENEDGTYTSNTEKYILNDINENQIKRLLNKKDLSFDDLTVLSVKKHETIINDSKTTITPTDLEPHYEVIVYDVNGTDTIVERETREDDLSDILIAGGNIVFIGALEGFLYATSKEDKRPIYINTSEERKDIAALKVKQKQLKKEFVI